MEPEATRRPPPGAIVAGLAGAAASYALLAWFVLWRTRPGLRVVSHLVGAVIAAGLGAVVVWMWASCRRAMGGRNLRDVVAAALREESRQLPAPREGRLDTAVRRRPLAFALACVALAYSLVLTLHPPTLEIDDVYWWMYVAGFGMSSSPDEHLWCHHHLFARGLAALYRAWPGGPWYGLHLAGVAVTAHFAICYALTRRHGLRGLVLFGLQLLVLDLYFAHHLQFTIEAGLATVGGILLIGLGLSRGEPHPWRHVVAGASLLVLACAVRWDMCFLLLGVFGPALVIEAWPLDKARLVRLGAVGLVCAAMLGATLENRAFYRRDPDWRDFHRQYLDLRQEIVEYTARRPTIDYTPETRAIFDEVGWCEADLRLVQRAVYYDDARITDEKVEQILAAFPRPWRLHPREWVAQLLEVASHPRVIPAAPLLALLLLGLSRRGWAALGAALAMWCAALVYFFNFAKAPPDRVYLPVAAGAVWLCAFFAGPRTIPPALLRPRWPRTTACQVLIALAVLVGAARLGPLAREGQRAVDRAAALRSAIGRLAPRPDRLFVITGCYFPYQDLLPFESIEFMRSMNILGTYHNCGFNRRRMRDLGISDLYAALYERDDVSIVSTEEINRWLAASIAHHRGVEVTFAPVFEGPEFTVYEVSKRARGS